MDHISAILKKDYCSKGLLKDLATPNPIKSMGNILLEWSIISTAIVVSEYYWNIATYIVAVMVIGARQHAIAVLMHDAAHNNLFKNRRLNDLVGNLLGNTILISLLKYRKIHFPHHKFVNSDKDPDMIQQKTEREYDLPKNKATYFWYLLRDMLFLGVPQQLQSMLYVNNAKSKDKEPTEPDPATFTIPAVQLTAIAIFAYFGRIELFLMYWVVPMATFLKYSIFVRALSEHHGIMKNGSYVRTMRCNFFERFFFYPQNIGFHFEHHRYPFIPLNNLPKLSKAMERHPDFDKDASVATSFLAVFDECSKAEKNQKAELLERRAG